MVTIYGIKACDTMKKAFTWLDKHGVAYTFHDYKKDAIDAATLKRWCKEVGYELLLNTKGTTWRKLSDADRENVTEAKAIKLMLANLSLIKRPVIEGGASLLVGFDEAKYKAGLR